MMAAINVEIAKPVLTWAAKQPNIALKPQLSSQLNQWITGKAEPTFSQIQKISAASGIPFGYFFLKQPPIEDIPLLKFRAINNADIEEPSRELITTIEQMECVQDWIKDYRRDNHFSNLPFVESVPLNSRAKDIAYKIMEYLGLQSDWSIKQPSRFGTFRFLRSRLNEAGITVMLNGICGNNTQKPLLAQEFRAFCLVDELAPLIFINNTDSEGAKVFSLLHETVHIWLGENDIFNDWKQTGDSNRKIERVCNAVAALILVPDEEFHGRWFSSPENDVVLKIEKLSNTFHCSAPTLARKALDAGFILRAQYEDVIQKAISDFENLKTKKKTTGVIII
jgi:Predicted Zn peptidase